MRANGMRPPSYERWVKEKAAASIFSKQREDNQNKRLATPEGKRLEEAYQTLRTKYYASMDEETAARSALEGAVLQKTGTPLYDPRSPKPNLTNEQIQKDFPAELKRLQQAFETTRKLGIESSSAADKRNDYLNS